MFYEDGNSFVEYIEISLDTGLELEYNGNVYVT